MPCSQAYILQPSIEDVLNQQRNQALQTLEEELGLGLATIQTDPITGVAVLVGGSVHPEGMSDLCVLDALQQRGSVEFQLAVAHAGLQDKNFTHAHAHAHAHGHEH